MNWKKTILLITSLLLAGLFTAWLLAPHVEDFDSAGSPLHGRQPLSISFSRPMNSESIEFDFNIDPLLPGELIWNEALNKFTFIPFNSIQKPDPELSCLYWGINPGP
jgi:hypothetical protein